MWLRGYDLSGLNAKSGIDVNTNNAPKKGFG
jgi:hypothetical protein